MSFSAKNQNSVTQGTACIIGAERGKWQSHVDTENGAFCFHSEMKLLNGLVVRYPALLPEWPEFKK